MSGCLRAWTETSTSHTLWRRTAGETTAASPPSQEYEPSFRRPPCLSSSRQVGALSAGIRFLLHPVRRKAPIISRTSKPFVCHALQYISPWFLILTLFVMTRPCCSHVHCVVFFVSSTSISEKSDMNPETGKFEDFTVKHSCAVWQQLRRRLVYKYDYVK